MVLIAGGDDANGNALASAELYDPAAGTFPPTGNLNTARGQHTATLLSSGMVLIAGGENRPAGYLASAELYNPATGTFTAAGNLNTARSLHTATLLSSGFVLIAGGLDGGIVEGGLFSAELYNPETATFTPTGSLYFATVGHTATLLDNSMVLIAGGYDLEGLAASAELYDPATGTFTITGSLNTPRDSHTATLLNNGMVLIAGGGTDVVLASAELYDPATGTFTTTSSLNTARYSHTATLLNNGLVLIAGGGSMLIEGGLNSSGALASAELYEPGTLTPPSLVSIAVTPEMSTLSVSGQRSSSSSRAPSVTAARNNLHQ